MKNLPPGSLTFSFIDRWQTWPSSFPGDCFIFESWENHGTNNIEKKCQVESTSNKTNANEIKVSKLSSHYENKLCISDDSWNAALTSPWESSLFERRSPCLLDIFSQTNLNSWANRKESLTLFPGSFFQKVYQIMDRGLCVGIHMAVCHFTGLKSIQCLIIAFKTFVNINGSHTTVLCFQRSIFIHRFMSSNKWLVKHKQNFIIESQYWSVVQSLSVIRSKHSIVSTFIADPITLKNKCQIYTFRRRNTGSVVREWRRSLIL